MNEDRFKENEKINDCSDCKYHDDFSWVCFNGDSPHRGDFVNCGCNFKLTNTHGQAHGSSQTNESSCNRTKSDTLNQ